MEWIMLAVDFILHVDQHVDVLVKDYGQISYGILFLIVFCETGLVMTPFLPGDSLLFAFGALAARGYLDPHMLFFLCSVAAIVGDATNYKIGDLFGRIIIEKKWVNPVHVKKTEQYYEKYGVKTVVLARFVPIIRTFAPFIAGITKMNPSRFLTWNVIGGILWSLIFIYAGFFFGELPIVRKSFTLVLLGIVFVSVLPVFIEAVRLKIAAKKS